MRRRLVAAVVLGTLAVVGVGGWQVVGGALSEADPSTPPELCAGRC